MPTPCKTQEAEKEQGQNVEGQGEKKPENKHPKQTKGRNQGANQVEIIFRFQRKCQKSNNFCILILSRLSTNNLRICLLKIYGEVLLVF